jgi:hypothetical protein
MTEKNKNIDDLFRDGLGDYTEVPDPTVWSDIERKLDAGDNRTGGAAGPGSGRRIFFWLVMGIALFFTAKWAISNLSDTKSANPVTITNESVNHAVTKNNATSPVVTANENKSNEITENTSSLSAVSSGVTATSNSQVTAPAKSGNVHKHLAPIGPPAMLSSLAPELPIANKPGNEVKTSGQNNFVFPKDYFDALQANTAFSLLDNKPEEELKLHNVDFDRLIRRIRKNLASGGLQGGIKLGFETGFNSYTATRLAVSPYIQYNVSAKLSVLLQPGLKFAHLSKNEFIRSDAYYNITNSSVTTGHLVQKGDSTLGAPDTITRRYYYKQTNDSILIGFNAAKRNYVEFELPVLLQYRASSKLSVYGGLNFNFGKVLALKENREVYSNIIRSDSVVYPATLATNTAPNPPAIDSLFAHNAKPFSGYSSTNAINPSSESLRVGYMLGVSYSFKGKWLIDVLMQQTFTDLKYIPTEKVRKIYSQPYFRVSVGYRLFKSGTASHQKK